MVGLLVICWLAAVLLVGWLAGWLAGWFVAGWLVGWTALGHHVGDLGFHWDTKVDSLGSRVGFPMIFSRFGEPVGS